MRGMLGACSRAAFSRAMGFLGTLARGTDVALLGEDGRGHERVDTGRLDASGALDAGTFRFLIHRR
ncbi:MAG: hypothetical protein OHK0013_28110 [Sandaracinaceae bacterium]